ncbi:MAG TPA: hypothetical protein VFW75_05290 [Acetobacteraceae bacterium]|nr:hypothetical protein [Acetobacteraceae bacterium]
MDLRELRNHASTRALATVRVVLATLLYAGDIWGVLRLIGRPVPFVWCIVLGAIPAPADPIAVSGLLREVGLPPATRHLRLAVMAAGAGWRCWCASPAPRSPVSHRTFGAGTTCGT